MGAAKGPQQRRYPLFSLIFSILKVNSIIIESK
jgi:hypothetical protein